MVRQINLWLLREYNALRALFQGCFEKGNHASRLGGEFMCKFFVVRYQVRDVDIAKVSLDQHILANLVAVDVRAIDLVGEYELFQVGLPFSSRLDIWVARGTQYAERVD